MTTPTYEDIPRILNSISWQLKRIADHLESTEEKEVIEKPITPTTRSQPDIRNMLAALRSNE